MAPAAACLLLLLAQSTWQPNIYDPTGSGIYPLGSGTPLPNYKDPIFMVPPQLPRTPKPRDSYPYEEPGSPVQPWIPRDVPGRPFG